MHSRIFHNIPDGVAEIIRNGDFESLINRMRKYLAWHSLLGDMRFNLYRSLGVRWVMQNVQGSKMLLDLLEDNPSSVNRNLFTYGVREPLSTKLFKRELKRGIHVVDIGANIGYYALLEARIVGNEGKVYAIEPAPHTFVVLASNVKINNYANISLHNIALGHRKGKARLKIAEARASNLSRITFDEIENTVEVEMTTLDEFLMGRRVDLARMDVEGFEYCILKGMEKTLADGDLSKIFIELHPRFIENYGGSTKEVLQKLTDSGFKAKYIIYEPPIPVKSRLLDDPSLVRVLKCDVAPISLLTDGYIVQWIRLFLER